MKNLTSKFFGYLASHISQGMKFIVLILFITLHLPLMSQVKNITFNDVKQIADHYAAEFWGDVLPDNPTPYYGPNDEVIAYQFNYAIGKEFSDKEALIEECNQAFESGNRDKGWGNDNYANMVIGAKPYMPVFIEYSKCLSKQYALGAKLEEAAKKEFGTGYTLEKTYYLGLVEVWFCYSKGNQKKYINLEPKVKILNDVEFSDYTAGKKYFWDRDDFKEDWINFLNPQKPLKSNTVFIPGKEDMPFIEWSYGCTPSSAAMLVAWWDNYHRFGNLIDYYQTRWDPYEGNYDHHVPTIQKDLAEAMDTEPDGSTYRGDICDGYIEAIEDRGYNCDSDGHWAFYWTTGQLFDDVKSEINNQRPIHISIDDHSIIGIGYNNTTKSISTHDPNQSTIRNISKSMLEGTYWVTISNNYGSWVVLNSPHGEETWNFNGNTHEVVNSNDFMEISWSGSPDPGTYAKLYYHDEGGSTLDRWFSITNNTPNDGSYDWHIPDINCYWGDTTHQARVKIEIYDQSDQLIAGDGSFGNFTILNNGGLPEVSNMEILNTVPDYYSISLYEDWWSVVGIRDMSNSVYWYLELYNDLEFNNMVEESNFWENVNYIVLSGHDAPLQEYGIKVLCSGQPYSANLQYEVNEDYLYPNSVNNLSWGPANVVKIWDIYLDAGERYFFEIDTMDVNLDLDMALFGSGDDNLFSRNDAAIGSYNIGMGVNEGFSFEPSTSGDYGLCVSSNNIFSGNYTIKISDYYTWVGAVSSDWYDPANWSGNIVPGTSDNVMISADYITPPSIYSTVYCNNLTIGSGAQLSVMNESLRVISDLTIFGELRLESENSKVEARNGISWESGSSAYMHDGAIIYVSRSWYFQSGSHVHLDSGLVQFVSDYESFILCKSSFSYFNNIIIDKPLGIFQYHYLSTHNLVINGNFSVYTGSTFLSNSENTIEVSGDITSNGTVTLNKGTLKLTGMGKSIDLNTSDYLNNLDLSTTSASLLFSDIHIKGDFIINTGGLAVLADIYLEGDWINNGGQSLFLEGNRKVVFCGNETSHITNDEEFNAIELDGSGVLYIQSNVLCQSYNWENGNLLMHSGSFTINDLVDDGIFGTITVEGGDLNIYQDANQSVDLNCELYLEGGNFNIYGGSGNSKWSAGGDAEIVIDDGILQFKDVGVHLFNSGNNLGGEINGGFVLSAGDIIFDNNNIDMTGGSFYFYGPGTAYLQSSSIVTIPNLIINKGSTKENLNQVALKTIKPSSKNGKSDGVILNSDINISGNLSFYVGSLNINGYKLEVGNTMDIYDHIIMNDPLCRIIAQKNINWEENSTTDITEGRIKFGENFNIKQNSSVQLGVNTELDVIGENPSFITNNATATNFGKIIFFKTGSQTTFTSSSEPFIVNGNFVIDSNNTVLSDGVDLTTNGTLFIEGNSSLINSTGNIIANSLTVLKGELIINSGNVTCHSGFETNSVSSLVVNGGDIILDRPYSSSYFFFAGDVQINNGTFEVTNEGIKMGQDAGLTMNNGILKVGWGILAQYPNNFSCNNGIVMMSGDSNSAIIFENSNYLYDLEIDKTNTSVITLVSDLTVNNGLSVNNGYLNILSYNLVVGGDMEISAAGHLQVLDGSIEVGGDWDNSGGSPNFDEGTSTVTFTGSEESHILNNENFYDLEINKTGDDYTYAHVDYGLTVNIANNLYINNRSLGVHDFATLNVDGDIVISDDGCLLAASNSQSNINIGGNWYNHNTSGSPITYGFYPGLSTVTFNGNEDQYVDADFDQQQFYNLVIDKPANAFYPLTDITVSNDLSINNGEWGDDDPEHTYNFYGDITIGAGGIFDDVTSVTYILGDGEQNLFNNSTTTPNFGEFHLNMSTGLTDDIPVFILQSDILCHSNIMIDTGNFILNSHTVECEGNFSVSENGKVTADGSSTIAMADGTEFEVYGGELQMLGDGTFNPTFTSLSGYYDFNVRNNGLMATSNATFENMGTNGINIFSDGLLWGTNAFSNCTFQNGIAGGTLLQINNNQDLVINGATFPDNTWSGSYNITKTINSGTVSFSNVNGNFSGQAFENDPFNRIDWGAMIPGIWAGTVSDVWNEPANWQNSLMPGATDDVYIPAGTPNDPVIYMADQECNNLTIESGVVFEIYNKTLTVHGNMLIYGELRMKQPNSILYAGDGFGDMITWEAGSGCDITSGIIYVPGDWRFRTGTSAQIGFGNTVIFNGVNTSTIYCNDDDASFGTLQINKPSPPKDYVFVSAKNSLRVSEDLTVIDGRLDVKEGCEVAVGNEFYVDNGGTFNIIGTSNLPSSFSGDADYCLLEVASGGSISADYTVFERIGSSGVLINAGATVNTNYPFSHCTFRESPAGGILLTVLNNQSLTIDGAVFPPNTWGGNYNISKTNNAGHITFTNVEGGFVGENYENDPYNRVDWPGVTAGIWEGTVSSYWNDSSNWKYYMKPTASDDVSIPASAPHQPMIMYADQECNNLTIESGASLTFRNRTLDVHSDIINYGTICMTHQSDILNAGDDAGDVVVWRAGSSASITDGYINVSGSWYFYDGISASFGKNHTTTFYGNNFSTIYCYDDYASFGKLKIYKTSAPHDVVSLNAGNSVKVNDNIYVSDGVFSITGGSVLRVNNSIYIDDGATISSIGTKAEPVSILGGTGFCNFEVAAGATISASYTTFENMESEGVKVCYDAIIDTLHPFNNCTFKNGRAGGTLLTINNEQFITIDSVSFPENTWNGTYNVTKDQNGGQVIFTNFNGLFAGEWFERDSYNRIDWNVPTYWLHIKVYLEGPFNGNYMNCGMADMPLQQPFNTPPWNYDGFESVPQIPTHIVDWVLVELRNAPDSASATSDRIIERRAVFLKDDGTITDLGGLLDPQFNKYISQNLYVVVRHRNHLDVMSAFPLQNVSGTYSYDFSPEKNRAYGSINGHKQLVPGVWGMIGGDANSDGIVDAADKDIWSTNAGAKGYKAADCNLDSQINNKDKNDIWLINIGKESQVPD